MTTNAATGGRLCLGIGLSHQIVVEGMWGLSFAHPLRHMREYLSVLVPLLDGKQVAVAGEDYRVNGAVTVGGASRPSVVVAALGPKMLQLAGAVAEAIRIGRESGAPVHISHFKSMQIPNWGRIRAAAAMVEKARAQGLKITADQYPYTANSFSLVDAKPVPFTAATPLPVIGVAPFAGSSICAVRLSFTPSACPQKSS